MIPIKYIQIPLVYQDYIESIYFNFVIDSLNGFVSSERIYKMRYS